MKYFSRSVIVASVVGDVTLPVAPMDSVWDEAAARASVSELAQGDPDILASSFLWFDDTLDPADAASYSLGFGAALDDGYVYVIPDAVKQLGDALEAGELPEGVDVEGVRAQLDALFAAVAEVNEDPSFVAPWGATEETPTEDETQEPAAPAPPAPVVASGITILTASGVIPVHPSVEWFDDPQLKRLTRWTVEDSGRVYGHIAPWGQCHIGIQDACVMAPKSMSNYAYFMLGRLRCEEGCRVDVGAITFDTGHADKRLNARAAAAHYDNTGSVAADVVMGEDEFGIWVAGALRPTLSDEQIRVIEAAKPSGDWRGVDGKLEMIATLLVNTPGFGTYEDQIDEDGRVETMIASLMPYNEAQAERNKFVVFDKELANLRRLTRPLLDAQVKALNSRVYGPRVKKLVDRVTGGPERVAVGNGHNQWTGKGDKEEKDKEDKGGGGGKGSKFSETRGKDVTDDDIKRVDEIGAKAVQALNDKAGTIAEMSHSDDPQAVEAVDKLGEEAVAELHDAAETISDISGGSVQDAIDSIVDEAAATAESGEIEDAIDAIHESASTDVEGNPVNDGSEPGGRRPRLKHFDRSSKLSGQRSSTPTTLSSRSPLVDRVLGGRGSNQWAEKPGGKGKEDKKDKGGGKDTTPKDSGGGKSGTEAKGGTMTDAEVKTKAEEVRAKAEKDDLDHGAHPDDAKIQGLNAVVDMQNEEAFNRTAEPYTGQKLSKGDKVEIKDGNYPYYSVSRNTSSGTVLNPPNSYDAQVTVRKAEMDNTITRVSAKADFAKEQDHLIGVTGIA